VKNRFQNLPFKFNLQRYIVDRDVKAAADCAPSAGCYSVTSQECTYVITYTAGLCTLNQVYP
jgi:hypothetical protein